MKNYDEKLKRQIQDAPKKRFNFFTNQWEPVSQPEESSPLGLRNSLGAAIESPAIASDSSANVVEAPGRTSEVPVAASTSPVEALADGPVEALANGPVEALANGPSNAAENAVREPVIPAHLLERICKDGLA